MADERERRAADHLWLKLNAAKVAAAQLHGYGRVTAAIADAMRVAEEEAPAGWSPWDLGKIPILDERTQG